MDNGRLVYGFKGNFLLRARPFIVDDEFATVTTNSTHSEERIQAGRLITAAARGGL
jgi:hypothetical protein